MRAVLLVAIVIALGSAVPASGASGGLRGVVSKGPTTPVCAAEVPCTKPVAHVLVTFTRGASRRTATTDAEGRYRVALTAGVWSVTIAGARFGPRPRSVVVPSGRVAVQNFTIDTGIR